MTCSTLTAIIESNPGLYDLIVAMYGDLARAIFSSCGL